MIPPLTDPDLIPPFSQQDGEILAFLGRNDVCGDSHWRETKVQYFHSRHRIMGDSIIFFINMYLSTDPKYIKDSLIPFLVIHIHLLPFELLDL